MSGGPAVWQDDPGAAGVKSSRFGSRRRLLAVAVVVVLVLGGGTALAVKQFVLGGGPGATAVAVSDGHSCALLANGGVVCWGSNSKGELGDGTLTDSATPVAVSGVHSATAIASSLATTCALLSDGSATCWGNRITAVADNKPVYDSYPVPVAGISRATAIATGSDAADACVVVSGGTVQCWPVFTQFGAASVSPETVSGISGASVVTVGSTQTCALITDGTVSCWGYNSVGELGTGEAIDQGDLTIHPPRTVTAVSGARSVAAGSNHTCALLSDGSVVCWGSDVVGQLGDGTFTSPDLNRMSSTRVRVAGLNNARSVWAGDNISCAILADESIHCWGDNNDGSLGDGTTTIPSAPVPVSGLSGAIAMAVNSDHSCAVTRGGAVSCWGQNTHGELGDGTVHESLVPVRVASIGN